MALVLTLVSSLVVCYVLDFFGSDLCFFIYVDERLQAWSALYISREYTFEFDVYTPLTFNTTFTNIVYKPVKRFQSSVLSIVKSINPKL